MGEILPDGSIQGYQGYCKKCHKTIDTNLQGNESGRHICKGSKIKWTYKHWLNSKSSTLITKNGILIEYISEKLAKVLFNGNKHPSSVLVAELFMPKKV